MRWVVGYHSIIYHHTHIQYSVMSISMGDTALHSKHVLHHLQSDYLNTHTWSDEIKWDEWWVIIQSSIITLTSNIQWCPFVGPNNLSQPSYRFDRYSRIFLPPWSLAGKTTQPHVVGVVSVGVGVVVPHTNLLCTDERIISSANVEGKTPICSSTSPSPSLNHCFCLIFPPACPTRSRENRWILCQPNSPFHVSKSNKTSQPSASTFRDCEISSKSLAKRQATSNQIVGAKRKRRKSKRSEYFRHCKT